MVENQQPAAIALVWLFPAITSVLVGLRVWSRYLGRNFGWDDGLIGVAFVLAIVESLATYEMVIWSQAGYHVWDIPPRTIEEQTTALKWSFTLQLSYHLLMGAIRASIILFLFRFGDARRHIYYALKFVFWFNILYTVASTIANILTCDPVRYIYDRPSMDQVVDGQVIPGGKCFSTLQFVLACCALSIFMDLIIIPIPTAMVWNLAMPRKTKIAVVMIMSLGWIATAVSGVRFFVYYYRWQPDFKDRNYDIGFVVSIAEANVAMWAACAPALKRLISHWLPRLFSSTDNDYYTSTADGRFRAGPAGGRRRQRSNRSGSLSIKRESTDEPYPMDNLGHDSASQERIIPNQGYSIAVGARSDPMVVSGESKRIF